MTASRKIISIRTCQVIHQGHKRIFHKSLAIDFEPGVGLASGAASDITPMASLQWSDDGGNTWTTAQDRTIGVSGDYDARCEWNRLGYSRNRLYKLTISANVKKVIIAAHLDAEGGAS